MKRAGFWPPISTKRPWQDDVRAFRQTCADWKIPAALERSRSRRGGHVWIFFDAPLPAGLARKLGVAILTRTMERRHQLGLDSYDRFFRARTQCQKGALAISSRYQCNSCRAAMATLSFSPLISIRIPTSGHFCPASGGCLPKFMAWIASN